MKLFILLLSISTIGHIAIGYGVYFSSHKNSKNTFKIIIQNTPTNISASKMPEQVKTKSKKRNNKQLKAAKQQQQINNIYSKNWDKWLNVEVVYPQDSIRMEEEGLVQIKLVLTNPRSISNAVITQSSGFARLDQAILYAISKASLKSEVIGTLEKTISFRFQIILN